MTAPLVSIGMPVYNGGALLRRALDSIVAIEYPNLEIIISDNASTDSTQETCRAYVDRDPRITLLRQPRNIGALNNFRAVLYPAKGAYFMWAAADDWWDAKFVRVLLSELEANPHAVVAMCAVDRVLETGELYDCIRFSGARNPNVMDKCDLLPRIFSPAKMNLFIYGLFRRVVLDVATRHFPDTLGGDRQFIGQMAFAGAFRYVDQVLHVRTLSHSRSAAYRNQASREHVRAHQLLSLWRMLSLSPLVDWRDWRLVWSTVWRYWQFLKVP